MVANIIATIMMALGVATGNVSSNVYKGGNAFYDAEQKQTKPILKANETESNTINYNSVQTYGTQPNSNYPQIEKFYMGDDEHNTSAVYAFRTYNIWNSTYSYRFNDNNNLTRYVCITIMNITTYHDFATSDITLNQKTNMTTGQSSNFGMGINGEAYESDPQQNRNYIDLNLTSNTIDALQNYRSTATRINYWNDALYRNNSTHQVYEDTSINYVLYNLEPNQTKGLTIITSAYVGASNETIGYIHPTNGTVVNTYQETEGNYEIIDVPNMMYTILTMPFSFISTAFNLTIFPNTPYALNFGNLFLTIVAIFILLWIIKKVFH